MSEKPTEESWRRAENVVVDAINACVFDGMRRTIALALDEAEKRGAERERRQSPEKSPRHFIDKQTGE